MGTAAAIMRTAPPVVPHDRLVAAPPRSLARAGGVAASPAQADAGARHGVTVTVLLAALLLLASAVSNTAFVPSAHASRKHVLGGVASGIPSVTVAVWLAPAASAGSTRYPTSRGSLAL